MASVRPVELAPDAATAQRSRAERSKLRRELGRLAAICLLIAAIVVLDTLGAVATGGAQMLVWLAVVAVLFFVPAGLVIAELGAAFANQGGPYVWTRLAFGRSAGSLDSLVYFVETPVWVGGRRGVGRPGPRRAGLDRQGRGAHLRPVRGPGAGHRAGRPGRPASSTPGHRVLGLRALGGPGRAGGRAGHALDHGRQRAHLGDGVLADPGGGQPRRRRPGHPGPGVGPDRHPGGRHPDQRPGRHRHHPATVLATGWSAT